MKLGTLIGYSGATVNIPIDMIKEAENLGFESAWVGRSLGLGRGFDLGLDPGSNVKD